MTIIFLKSIENAQPLGLSLKRELKNQIIIYRDIYRVLYTGLFTSLIYRKVDLNVGGKSTLTSPQAFNYTIN